MRNSISLQRTIISTGGSNYVIESTVILSLLIVLLINGIAYLIAYCLQTDKLTDLTYSLTFITLAVFFMSRNITDISILIASLPIIWGIRLGSYLFYRILLKGKDYRFDSMRRVWWRFGGFWMIQALSIWVISLPYVLALDSSIHLVQDRELSITSLIGIAIFSIGFITESIADFQKFRFKRQPENKGNFISSGLYSFVRFPNYTGEIMVWIGIFITCWPYLEGWALLSIVSPIWIIILLNKISGIPYLAVSQNERYGELLSYKEYVRSTKKLVPLFY